MRDRGAEGVQVYRHQIEGEDLVRLELAHVARQARARQQPRVNGGVQRLDPPVEDLGKMRDVLHAGHRKAGFAQRGRRAARGHDFPAQRDESPSELDDAALVADRDQGTGHIRQGSGVKIEG